MMTPQVPMSCPAMVLPTALTAVQFHALAAIPPELEWFANLPHQSTHWVYQQDIQDFMAVAALDRTEPCRELTCIPAQTLFNAYAFLEFLMLEQAGISGLIIR
jgi:hypothetical protein